MKTTPKKTTRQAEAREQAEELLLSLYNPLFLLTVPNIKQALFKAIADWATSNDAQGMRYAEIETFHMLFDHLNDVDEWVKEYYEKVN